MDKFRKLYEERKENKENKENKDHIPFNLGLWGATYNPKKERK